MPARPLAKIRTTSFVLAVTVGLIGLAGVETWHPQPASAVPTAPPVEATRSPTPHGEETPPSDDETSDQTPPSPSPPPSASPTPDPTPRAAAASALSLQVSASPTSVSRVGQPVAYAFVVRAGTRSLDDLVVRAPFPGLSALVCAPTPLGGALAAGAATTCRATRRATALDLAKSSLDDTARASARSGTTAVGATSRVQVAVGARPPVATDDRGFVVEGGATIVLEGSHDDRPGTAGGPAIDPGRTVLVSDFDEYGGKYLRSDTGIWTVRPDGRVSLEPADHYDDEGDFSESVTYRVFDVAGRSSTARLSVTQLHDAVARVDQVRAVQATPVTIDVLGNDYPGERPGGGRARFDLGSVRLNGSGYGVLAPDGKRLRIPYEGTFEVVGDGKVAFTPLRSFRGESFAGYEVTSSSTGTAEAGIDVVVRRVTPTVRDERLTTTYGRGVTFPAARAALPGAESAPILPAATILVAPGVEPGGKTYTTRAGTWSVRADGTVRFDAASGYSGTSSVAYGVGDTSWTRVFATLTVTVRKGPKTVLVQGSTPVGAPLTLRPLLADTPGQRVDGSTAAFDRTSVVLLAALSPGSSVADGGRTLTVPGQGVWRVDAGTGAVSFAPDRSFAGAAATVTYRVRDDGGSTVDGRLAVAVVGGAPVATDDLAGTPATAPVVVPGATNDRAGAAALRPALTVFPSDGQPTGSSRAADGKTLAVPGQGTWLLGANGSATFRPAPAFVGTTTAVTYRVSDAVGATATALMRVVVQAGPVGRPDVARLGLVPGAAAEIRPLDNDVPGRNADGSIGTTDGTSLRLATTGQAPGWTVRADGLYAEHASGVWVEVSPGLGRFDVHRFYVSTSLTLALRYTTRDSAVDVRGAVVHRTVASTLQIDVPVRRPTANNDHASTVSPFSVELPAATNDLPGDPSVPISREGSRTIFPSKQLAQLPPGSTLDASWPTAVLTVPHEGRWERHVGSDGTVLFVPDPGFVGDTTPVLYQGQDLNGSLVQGTLQVTVRRGAYARADTARTPQGVSLTVDLLANDDPGLQADGTPAVLDGSGAYFLDVGLPPGATRSELQDVVTVPGQGRYSLQPGGRVVFRPDPRFRGTGTRLILSLANRRSGMRVTVDPVAPVARPDAVGTGAGQPVVVPVLANDTTGSAAVPLVAPSVRLRLAPDLPTGSALAGDAKSLTIPGRGVFLVSGQGGITFVPQGSVTGAVPTVAYQVADANGTTARSTLKVTVR